LSAWEFRKVFFNFQISDWMLFRLGIPMQVRGLGLDDNLEVGSTSLAAPAETLRADSRGYLIRGMPVTSGLPPISSSGNFIVYAPHQYSHYYITMDTNFEDYAGKFSSKTRSTIRRKVSKYATESGGEIKWATYSKPNQIREFFEKALQVSTLTYQERMFNGGLPDSEAFIGEAMELASNDNLRAFLLFHNDKPVSYLYCPVKNDILIYAYLGYDPDYQKLSVGTVLQWLALEQLFDEKRYRYFDFTEGQSEHKRLFSTDSRDCANVYWLKKGLRNHLLIRSHRFMDTFSAKLGEFSEKIGLKAKIKRFLRSRG
jgi:hypothetical protein